MLGGAVAGGQVFGDKAAGYYPDLQNSAAIDTGQGRLIPGVAVDEYARDLLGWFGVSNANLDYVLPAFSSRFGGRTPLGIFDKSVVNSPPPVTPPPVTPPTTSTPTTTPSSSGGGGGGGAVSPLFLAALGTIALVRLRQKRMAKKKPGSGSEPATT